MILFLNINSKFQIKFHKYNSLSKFLESNITFFVNYFIENIYSTQFYIGEPSQKIIGFLKPGQSKFYLSNSNTSCKSKDFYNYKKSNNFKLIKKQSQSHYNLCYFSDSFLIEKTTNSKNITSKIENFEIILIGDLKQSLCLVFGTRLISYEKDLKRNFLYSLHKNNHINSYYFSFDINTTNNDELTYIFDIDINEITNDYRFIKTTSRSK